MVRRRRATCCSRARCGSQSQRLHRPHQDVHAKGSVAFQTNRNIKLSDGAWAESVPNLDIENNDVKCSHASAVGPIDEDQRFYLESRGVHPSVAERLIVLGFFDEVIDQLPLPAVAAELRLQVAAKLDRRRTSNERFVCVAATT